MGVEIYTMDENTGYTRFVLVCNTLDKPFSSVMYGSRKKAELFLSWLPEDVRGYDSDSLYKLYDVFSNFFYEVDDEGNLKVKTKEVKLK